MHSTDRLSSYFSAQARLGRTHQHPGGRPATERLLSLLRLPAGQPRVLELGCGAGHLASLLLERFDCIYTGIDSTPAMLRLASSRVERYPGRAALLRTDLRGGSLPLRDASMDAVVAESVMAIVDTRRIVAECCRVLKRGGILAWNDRIWAESISAEDRLELNRISRRVTGFDAAPLEPATAEDWRQLAEKSGFALLACERVKRSPAAPSGPGSGMVRKLRLLGGFLAHPSTIPIWIDEQYMARAHARWWNMMEDWLFVVRKQ